MEQHWQLPCPISDPVGRKEGWAYGTMFIKSTVVPASDRECWQDRSYSLWNSITEMALLHFCHILLVNSSHPSSRRGGYSGMCIAEGGAHSGDLILCLPQYSLPFFGNIRKKNRWQTRETIVNI